jgi:hypothetical protein
MARVGDQVTHSRWGAGIVRRILDGGRRWLVSFDSNPSLPRTVPCNDLAQARPRIDLPKVQWNAPSASIRQALEALRLGVVPAHGLEALTVGRDKEAKLIHDLLSSSQGLLLLSGGYGSGKTHLIELAEAAALASNTLVARVTFDPEETPPSHPMRIYRVLASELKYPGGSARGLLPLLEKLADSRDHTSPDGRRFHRYLSPAAWTLTHADDVLVEDVIAYVEGQLQVSFINSDLTSDLRRHGWRGPSLLSLHDYRTFGQIMANLLGAIATWSRDAGYRGLLVLCDEAEYLDQLEATSREMATRVLKYLAMATLPQSELAFDPTLVERGGQPVHRDIPTRFAQDQPLSAICAFTPYPEIQAVLGAIVSNSERLVSFDPVPLAALYALADRILAFYIEAYPELQPSIHHRQMITSRLAGAFRRGETEVMRQATKMVVEFWDLYRCDPDRALRALGS